MAKTPPSSAPNRLLVRLPSWLVLLAAMLAGACGSNTAPTLFATNVLSLTQQQQSAGLPIRSRLNPQKCIVVPSSTFADETRLQIADCDGTAAQAFSRNYETITIGPNNSCIDVTDGNSQDGTPLQIYKCYPESENQRFTRRIDGLIQWTKYNLCFNLADPNATDGAAIDLQTCDPSQATQMWDFNVPSPQPIRTSIDQNKCIDVPRASFNDGSKLQIYDCNGSDAQNWYFNGANITIGPSSLCMDLTEGADQPGTLAQIFESSNADANQLFTPRSDGLIQWTGKDLCLDLSGGDTTNGSAIDFQICDPNQPSQHWNFGIYTPPAASCKRGIAYGFHAEANLAALSPSLGWWHNFNFQPELLTTDVYAALGLEFVPAAFGSAFDLNKYPVSGYLLTFNPPAYDVQLDLAPSQAALLWPQIESIAAQQNLKIVGPALDITGDNSGLLSPFDWYDQFFAACPNCQVDFIALHWQGCVREDLMALLGAYESRYQRPLWVTEISCSDPNIADPALRAQCLQDVVSALEQDANVFRYAWFTGRYTNESQIALFGADGELTELGQAYRDAPGGCGAPSY